MGAIWEINEMEGKNPVHTGGFLTGYDHRQFSPDEVAARESCQNSMDAGRDIDGITNLVFQRLRAKGTQKTELLKLLRIKSILEPRLRVFSKEDRNKLFANNLKQFFEEDTVQALLIRDFNTCGLGGKWNRYEKHDHFARLVCALNLDDKADGDSNSGGSFGLGKTAYAKSSKINTVIYHSVFEPIQHNVHRRLMVSGVYPKHKLGKKNYGGFAYFGEEEKNKPNIVAPFQNKKALEYWDKISDLFGVDISRTSDQIGTDILILMDSLDLGDIQKAVEDYYFPALISKQLSVTFINERQTKTYPSIQARGDLDQFVDLYKKAMSAKDEAEETLEVAQLNKRHGYRIGKVAFQSFKNDSIDKSKENLVAIMRGTGMVINYVKMGSDQFEPAVGVFVASEEIHKFLQFAENAAHSEWSEHSQRLQRNFPDTGKKVVAHVNSIGKKRFQDFQKRLQPDVSTTRSERGLLARLLTGALAGSTGMPKPEKFFLNPVSIHLTQKQRVHEKSVWNLTIRDCENTPESTFNLTMYPSVSLAGDSKLVPIKHMHIHVKGSDGSTVVEGTKPEMSVDFNKGSKIDYYIEIPNPGQRNYIVHCKFIATSKDDHGFARK